MEHKTLHMQKDIITQVRGVGGNISGWGVGKGAAELPAPEALAEDDMC